MRSPRPMQEPLANPAEAAVGQSADSRAPARQFALHLLCLVVPLTTLAFVLTGPHPGYVAVAFLLPVALSVMVDRRSGPERRQPASTLPRWPFDALLYLLTALQLANVVALARMISVGGFWRIDTLVAVLLVGTNSGYSAIVVAHELIHRRKRHLVWMGRLLLCTVLYEHFYTEHIRGHHVRVGTPEDPATARFGESYNRFFLRTVPGQFRSAWRLEAKRLGDEDMKWYDPRLLRSRVVHGLVLELGLAGALLAVFGPAALAVHLIQALGAVRLLEAVNYFEHWGLVRSGRKIDTVDSWDTDSWFTLYTLVGLSRHADHHAHATRPYQSLRYFDESPKLPSGYFGTVWLLLTNNRRFRKLMANELERRGLGPFGEDPPTPLAQGAPTTTR